MKALVLIIFGCLVAGAAYGIKSVMDLPIVQISNSTASCVKVYTPDGTGSCDQLPERFEVVIVE